MQFRAKIAKSGEGLIDLDIEANSIEIAKKQIVEQGLTLVSIRSNQPLIAFPKFFKSRFSVSLFSQELLALMDAGLQQVEALETILEKERRARNRKLLQTIINRLYEGKSLSEALQEFPEEFPLLYVAMVKASEKTGNIGDSLLRYINYQAQVEVIRKKVTSASIYPLVLLATGSLVTMFLMLYVVPKFSQIYKDMGHNLPFFSRMLMNWGQFLSENMTLVLALIVFGFIGLFYACQHPAGKRWAFNQIKKIPTIGNRLHMYQLARFYRTFGMLLKGGVPVVPALEMVSGLLQSDLRVQLNGAIESVREGKPASDSLEKYGLTTPISMRLLRVGERTGRIDEMSERIANMYDDEMARWVDWFTKLFEPLLMGAMGLIIGLIVVLMYFPIFELAGSIQ